jgi:hypothetical protein
MKSIFFSLILICFFSSTIHAQRGYVRDAIEQKYEDKYMNDSSSALKQWMYGNLTNVKVEPTYTFSQTLMMHTTTYKKDKISSESDMEIYLNSSKKTMGFRIIESTTKKDDITMIYDYTQNAMITLNNKEMTGMAITLNAFMSREQQEQMKSTQSTTANTNTDCKKTGNTKMIQGYKCEEYVCINTERNTKVVMWICPSIFNQNINSSFLGNYLNGYSYPTAAGMAMECLLYKNDVLETEMEVTQFNKTTTKTISTSAYAINKM